MATHDLKALTRRWFEEVWNKQRPEAVDELFAADAKGYGLGHAVIAGPEQFKQFQSQLLEALPDLHVEIKDLIQEGDRTAIRFTVSATHSGNSLGVIATGKRVEFEGLGMARWHEGKVVETWNVYDQLGLMVQVGAVTLPQS